MDTNGGGSVTAFAVPASHEVQVQRHLQGSMILKAEACPKTHFILKGEPFMSEINLVQLVPYLLPRLTTKARANLINGVFMLQSLRQDLANLVYNTGSFFSYAKEGETGT